MIKYWWIVLVGALFALSGCEWERTTEIQTTYPIEGMSVYQGQTVSSLFNDNGAPNKVQNMPDGSIVWTYYTNYQPVGGGELISYDMPTGAQAQTTCTVQVIIVNGMVSQVMQNNC
jgi:hypothetical protein